MYPMARRVFFISNSYDIPNQKHKKNYSGKLFLSCKHWNLDFEQMYPMARRVFFISNSYDIPNQKHKKNYSGKLFLSPGHLTNRLRRT